MRGYRFYKREWLNKPGHFSSAHVLASVDDSATRHTEVQLHIGDCDRKLHLSLPLYDATDRRNTLFKLRRLIEVLTELEENVAQVCAFIPNESSR